jgi:hypothetical protein
MRRSLCEGAIDDTGEASCLAIPADPLRVVRCNIINCNDALVEVGSHNEDASRNLTAGYSIQLPHRKVTSAHAPGGRDSGYPVHE